MPTTAVAIEPTSLQPSRFYALHTYRQQLRQAGALKRLSQSAALVLLALADFADPSGYCWPSIGRIVSENPISERSARRALRELETAGLLISDERPGHSTRYRLVMTPVTVAPQPGQRGHDPCHSGPQNKTLKTKHVSEHQQPHVPVVVSSKKISSPDKTQDEGDRLPHDLYQALKRIGVKAPWRLVPYGEDRIREALKALELRTGIKNAAAWLVTALRDGWNFDKPELHQADTAKAETRARIEAETIFRAKLNTPEELKRSKLGFIAATVKRKCPSPDQLAALLTRFGIEPEEWARYVPACDN